MRLRPISRRTRRRLFVVTVAGFLGLGFPTWVPGLLATLPAFRVERVEVRGARYVSAEEVTRLLAIDPDASVWDDPSEWENRVRAHPMIREVTVRREGLRALEIVVVEKRAVALVATPDLRPVNGEGRLLPLDPAAAALDLPVIPGPARVEGDSLVDPELRDLAALLDVLDRSVPEFVSIVSEVRRAEGGGYEFSMLPSADAGVVVIPAADPLRSLRRVSFALGQIDDPRVARADARFAGQVVLTRTGGR